MTVEEEILENDEPVEDVDNVFLVMWCNEGLECIIPVDMSKIGDGADMLAILEDRKNEYELKMSKTLNMMKLRARFNSQRHYEIYALRTAGDISKKNLESLFEHSPQSAANLIRERGAKLHSARATEKAVIF